MRKPLLSLGGINKLTHEYVYPKIANKKDKYICPECDKDLILCQGKIKIFHFRHKVDNINPCHHYSYPTEAQVHKDAKKLLKTLLERKISIKFIRNCNCCKNEAFFEISEISETSVIQLEYRFEYNNGIKIADIAYIENGKSIYIFEILNTHKTCRDNRPEPWFEIDATELISIANNIQLTSLQIHCKRDETCKNCIEENEKKKRYLETQQNLKNQQYLENQYNLKIQQNCIEENEKKKRYIESNYKIIIKDDGGDGDDGDDEIEVVSKDKSNEAIKVISKDEMNKLILKVKQNNEIKVQKLLKRLDDVEQYNKKANTFKDVHKYKISLTNIRDQVEIELIMNNIEYHNNNDKFFRINNKITKEQIIIHSFVEFEYCGKSYKLIWSELIKWYNNNYSKFNIIDCCIMSTKLINGLPKYIEKKEHDTITIILNNLEENSSLCKYYYGDDFLFKTYISSELLLECKFIQTSIEYTIKRVEDSNIYKIKIPNKNEYIKYSVEFKQIYTNKKWHTNIKLDDLLYN